MNRPLSPVLASAADESLDVLYHFDQVFSHRSQTALKWTLEVFHHGSQVAVNTSQGQFLHNISLSSPIWLKKWTVLVPVTVKFHLWTLSPSVHECHASHPVNTWSKWYSNFDWSKWDKHIIITQTSPLDLLPWANKAYQPHKHCLIVQLQDQGPPTANKQKGDHGCQ